MRLVIGQPTTDLCELSSGERERFWVGRDTVPQILHVEDALRLGHFVEGGFHGGIVVAADPGRQVPGDPAEAVVPEALPAGARRAPEETP